MFCQSQKFKEKKKKIYKVIFVHLLDLEMVLFQNLLTIVW